MFFKKFCLISLQFVCYGLNSAPGVESSADQTISATRKQLHQIEMSVDQTVDPCDDFYGYACNNWSKHHTDTNYNEIFGQVDYHMNTKMISVIETDVQHHHEVNDSGQNFVEKIQIYYKACNRETSRNVTRYFDEIKPGIGLEWPLTEELQAHLAGDVVEAARSEWPNGPFNVFALLGELQGYGLNNVLISQEIARTVNGSLQILLEVPHVKKNDFISLMMLRVLLSRLGLPKESALKYAKEIKKTEMNWFAVYKQHFNTSDNEPEKLTYAELKRVYPTLADFLEHIIAQQIRDTDYVAIQNKDYFEFLWHKTWSAEESRNISNYVMMKFLHYLIMDGAKSFTKLDCLKDVRNKMNMAVNYLYQKYIYQPQARSYNSQISQLSRRLLKGFLVLLDENHLNLSPEQLEYLKRRLSSLEVNLGILPTHEQIGQIEEYYRDVPTLEPENYYKNHLHLLRHRFLKSLVYRQNQTLFISLSNRMGSTSNPFYIPKHNTVIIPTAFLQPPIYHSEYHPILEWSMLGFILAHEYSHALGTTRLVYSNDGRLPDTQATVVEHTNFTASLECMQKQAATDTIEERLADLIGARVAYTSFLSQHNLSIEPKFSQRSWKSLFFLNMAQLFCGRKNIQFIDHDADVVRLQQIVSNLDGFAEAFQCPVGRSKMNPSQKCRLF